MNPTAETSASEKTHANSLPRTLPCFAGFDPLTANYLYCPNQFFDVCLKSNSRGVLRVVAYIMRQTLGWLDQNGKPINQQIRITYKDLIRKAGVSRGAIGPALEQAVQEGFIQCDVSGKSKSAGQSSRTAQYSLRWDHGPVYQNQPQQFAGFFTGEGHRTPIPNAFFDHIVPSESLAVGKVVGAVLRHTIGYQNQFGGRRSSTPLSHSQIRSYCNLSSGKTLTDAINSALQRGYISRPEAGCFSSDKSQQVAATYAVRWLQKGKSEKVGSKIPTELEQFRNPNSNGSRIPAGDRFKNPNSIEKTKQKDTLKQQNAASDFQSAIQRLVVEGFDKSAARKLIESRGLKVVNQQLDWISARRKYVLGQSVVRWTAGEEAAIGDAQTTLRVLHGGSLLHFGSWHPEFVNRDRDRAIHFGRAAPFVVSRSFLLPFSELLR